MSFLKYVRKINQELNLIIIWQNQKKEMTFSTFSVQNKITLKNSLFLCSTLALFSNITNVVIFRKRWFLLHKIEKFLFDLVMEALVNDQIFSLLQPMFLSSQKTK